MKRSRYTDYISTTLTLHLFNSAHSIFLDLTFLLVPDNALTITRQVHGHGIAKKGTDLFYGKAFRLGDVKVGNNERYDTEASVYQEHAPLTVISLESGHLLCSQDTYMLCKATGAGVEKVIVPTK